MRREVTNVAIRLTTCRLAARARFRRPITCRRYCPRCTEAGPRLVSTEPDEIGSTGWTTARSPSSPGAVVPLGAWSLQGAELTELAPKGAGVSLAGVSSRGETRLW